MIVIGFSLQMTLRAKKYNPVLTHFTGKKYIHLTIYEHEFVSQVFFKKKKNFPLA